MNKKALNSIIIVAIVVIIGLVLFDFLGNQPGKRGRNPYEYNVDNFKSVDSSLIHYRETRNIAIDNKVPYGFTIYQDELYLTGEQFLQVIRPDGVQIMLKTIPDTGKSIHVTEEFIFIGYDDHVSKFNRDGDLITQFERPGTRTYITSLASKGNTLYVADAGNRKVLRYDLDGNLLGEFKGKSESEAGHGFIIPSAKFDLVVNSYGDLWVVNPGEHAIENYTDEGQMRGFFKRSSMEIEGFTGCCNPAHICVLEDGSFVTSEKGMVRIKVYDESGKMKSVVAPPSKFKDEGEAPEVAADSKGNIYALDFDKKRIRIFEKNTI
jgi:sugar lactone lactonase YvrE